MIQSLLSKDFPREGSMRLALHRQCPNMDALCATRHVLIGMPEGVSLLVRMGCCDKAATRHCGAPWYSPLMI